MNMDNMNMGKMYTGRVSDEARPNLHFFASS